MSKAFTREVDFDPTLEVSVRPRDVLPPGVSNYITPAGAARLRDEQGELERRRPALLEEIAELVRAGRGDGEERRAAHRRLRELDEHIAWLGERIAGLEVVDPASHPDDRARFGARVTVMEPGGATVVYRIVGVDEAEAASGCISWISPLAKALLGAEAGDEVVVSLPRGDRRLEVVAVEYT